MDLLKFGSRGPRVQFLQLALNRAGFGPVQTDGIFGYATQSAVLRFQTELDLQPDGIVGAITRQALRPWYEGYTTHRIRRGDSLYTIARTHHTTVRRIETANPGLDPFHLPIGKVLTVPLAFPVVPTTISWTGELLETVLRGLKARYPFLETGCIGQTVLGQDIPYLVLGEGRNTVLYTAAHHANEWITAPLLMQFSEDVLQGYMNDQKLQDTQLSEFWQNNRVYIVPMVNPDGVDLVTGALQQGQAYETARAIAADFPDIPFPGGWKANSAGTDLNLQYPEDWEQAKAIKFAQGFDRPAPRDYVGTAPLTAPESRALYEFTRSVNPELVLAYHTQGEVIYWKYLNFDPPEGRRIAYQFAALSGYTVEETPYASGFAGYKDWFIQEENKPGYTIEVGLGENPLPISEFDEIYRRNLGILLLAAQVRT